MYNFSEPGTKTAILRVHNALHGVETPILRPSHTQGEKSPIPGSLTLPYIHIYNHKPGTKTVVPQGGTAPHGEETPNWGS